MEKRSPWESIFAWVNGDLEPRDQTLLVMDPPPKRHKGREEGDRSAGEQARVHHFWNWQPVAAVALTIALGLLLFAAVEPLSASRVVSTALALFGLGLLGALLFRSFLQKLLGFALMALSASFLLGALAPGGFAFSTALLALGMVAALGL